MLKLIIEDDEGRKTVVPFVRDEITIGRQEGNTIRLTERNVSRKHARLLRTNGHVVVEDLGSYNGIRVNGARIQGKSQVRAGDLIQIGDYDLAIQTETSAEHGAQGTDPTTDVEPPPPPPVEPTTRPDLAVTAAEPVSGENLVEVGPDSEPALNRADSDSARQTSAARRVSSAGAGAEPLAGATSPTPAAENIPAESAPRLVVLNTDLAGREFACIRTELRVGRDDGNDISVDDISVGSTHARLHRDAAGSWRVTAVEASSGLKVNGEPQTQAELRPGDVLELGVVHFQFASAGQVVRLPSGEAWAKDPLRRRPRVGLWLTALVLLAGGGYVGFREHQSPGFVSGLLGAPPEASDAPEADAPSTASPAIAEAPAEPPHLDQTLQAVKSAIAQGDLDQAAGLLGGVATLPMLSAERRAQMAQLQSELRREQEARDALSQAREQLAAGALTNARASLEKAEGTVAFATELGQLRTEVAEKSKPVPPKKPLVAVAKPSAVAAPPPPATPAPAPKRTPRDEADALFREGTDLFVNKQLKEAMGMYTRCLETDPTFARCHMMLGSTYARLGQAERGAQHYRTFIKLAPNDAEAAKVRILLEEYEKAKRRQVAPEAAP